MAHSPDLGEVVGGIVLALTLLDDHESFHLARKTRTVGTVYVRNELSRHHGAVTVLPSCFGTLRCLLRMERPRCLVEPYFETC